MTRHRYGGFMLTRRQISTLVESLVDKQCLKQKEADEILDREYSDVLALEATLDLDYCVDPSAWSIEQLTNLEEYYD